MARGAKLTSTEAVPEMSAAIERFRAEAMAALEELDMEVRRALEWIQHDQLDHWNREVHRGWDRISESRVQLQQAMTNRRIGNDDPSCVDEKKALERAKRRLDVSQDKLELTKHWARAVEKAVNELIGSRTSLANWIDCEAPKAVSALQRMADQIERYLQIQPDATIDLMKLAQTSEYNVAKHDIRQETQAAAIQQSVIHDVAVQAVTSKDVANPTREVDEPSEKTEPTS